ncbi:LRP1B [Cordylochernes scorpioides]|uniref:LRP1B n=1 Tax=Cordylochernes scorpioides TaxID=51811 RepID=A0ABY6KZW2_9ARAC|nr:LRP1B [Cordylochernes scorpioides]
MVRVSGQSRREYIEEQGGYPVCVCSQIYWTNWNTNNPTIQRAYTNGHQPHAIISTDIRMPNALTLDHAAQKLFWADARLDKIERCNYDGTDRHIISHVPQLPFDLAVYGNFIFWTDWVAHAVLRANKMTGGDVVELRKNIQRPMAIIAVANDSNDCE